MDLEYTKLCLPKLISVSLIRPDAAIIYSSDIGQTTPVYITIRIPFCWLCWRVNMPHSNLRLYNSSLAVG